MKKLSIIILTILSFLLLSCKNDHKSINLGSIQVLTGQMSKYGKTLQAALEAELEIINHDRTQYKQPQIKIFFQDDKLDPKTGVAAMQQLIQAYDPPVVFGALGSSVTLAIAPIANKNKVVLISPASGAPNISDAGDYVFRTCPSDIYEAKIIAKYYSDSLNGNSLAVLYINNDYGNGLKDSFLSSISNNKDILTFGFKQGQADFKNEITKIKSSNIQVIYLVGYEEMVTVFKQAKEMNLICKWLGNNQMNDQTIIDKFGNTAEGTIFPGHQYDLESIKNKYSDFYKIYLQKSGGVDLDVFAAYGVDALMVVNQVMLNNANTGEEIKEALYKLKGFKGITGEFSFDSNGDPVRELNLYVIKEGKIVKLAGK
ncbi:MAG: ABC transporter substrate-binding protein [Nanoarchaeota archaeon]|nr:ABC transporter substrate-binding protein [Nanoarchaeota archaeon]